MGWIISQALYEKWHCSQGQAVESLEDTCSDGKQSAPLNGNHTQLVYLSPDKMTAFSRLSQFGMMCRPLMESRGEDLLMWYREDFLVKTYPAQEREQESTERVAVCGRTWHELSEKFDLDSCSWKIHHSLFPVELDWSSVILPRWGMTVSGQLYQHQTLERPISGTGSGLWPTPRAVEIVESYENYICRMKASGNPKNIGKTRPQNLSMAVNLWPTPCATDYKGAGKNGELRDRLDYAVERGATKSNDYSMQVDLDAGGQLNPTWVEWLMAFPLGWTDLRPLEMHKFHVWLEQHSISCETNNA